MKIVVDKVEEDNEEVADKVEVGNEVVVGKVVVDNEVVVDKVEVDNEVVVDMIDKVEEDNEEVADKTDMNKIDNKDPYEIVLNSYHFLDIHVFVDIFYILINQSIHSYGS